MEVAFEDELKELAEKAAAKQAKKKAEKIELHHSDPKFMGGAEKQELTAMEKSERKALHRELNEHLEGYVASNGKSMRPKRGNSGLKIQATFSRGELLNAMSDFYKGAGAKYAEAARDFFKQHPGLQ